MSAQDKAEMIDLFGRALSRFPKWAVARGFDAWERTATRRPSPGDIAKHAQEAMRDIGEELAKRERQEAERIEAQRGPRIDPETAQKILAEVGFRPKKIP